VPANENIHSADTARVIGPYADVVVIRHPADGAARVLADYADALAMAVYQERTVQTVWVRWYPGNQALRLDSHLVEELTTEERERLTELGITGYLDWRLSSTLERGPFSRIIIIMQRPISDPVELALPEREPVIYVQQPDGTWIVDPPGAAMLEKTIRLAQDPDRPQATAAFLKVPGGTVIFGGIDWSADPPP